MNRKTFLAALLASSTLAGTQAWAATIAVSNGGSIQAAVNSAGSGDMVLVHPGTYAPFEINRDNITVKSSVPGTAHVIAKGGSQPAIGSYGQSNISIEGFRVTSHGGDGMKITGSPEKMVSNLRVEGNVIESAWLDGIKMSHAEDSTVKDNAILAAGVSGPAGKGNNHNGDGGIDWVRVNNSEMIGNEVSTNGWACAMVKNGSNGNLIKNNRFRRCEVNGVDMAAPSTGAAAATNKSGMVAYNNIVEGNEIAGGKGCIVKLHKTSKNNKIIGNATSGRDCGDPNGSNNASATVGTSTVGSEDTEGGGSGGTGGTDNQSNLLQLASMAGSSSCGTEAGAAMAVAGAASGIFTGGRATVVAQLAQQVQLIFQSMCAAEQLAAQLRMIETLGINTADDVVSAMTVVQNALGMSQQVSYELAKADADWSRVFMETNGLSQMPAELAFPALGKRYAEMRSYSNAAMKEAARVRALGVTNMKAGNARTKQAANASASAVGATQAIQAGNLLVLETRQELQGMHQTMLSYNEAQSRIDQEKRVQGVLASIFMTKNMESMNPAPTPVQGAVMWDKGGQKTVADFDSDKGVGIGNGVSAGSLSN